MNARPMVKQPTAKILDPMAAFRDMRDTYLDAWSKTMVDAVNTEAYAKASGQMLDTYPLWSAPFREIWKNNAPSAATTEQCLAR